MGEHVIPVGGRHVEVIEQACGTTMYMLLHPACLQPPVQLVHTKNTAVMTPPACCPPDQGLNPFQYLQSMLFGTDAGAGRMEKSRKKKRKKEKAEESALLSAMSQR